jgi:hypothetical protein
MTAEHPVGTESNPRSSEPTGKMPAQDCASDTLVSEADVLTRWPALSRAALLAARKSQRIGWVRGKRGSAWYRPSAVEIYISQELEQPCRAHAHDHYLNSVDSGSPTTQDRPSSTVSGLSPALEEHAARACAQKI